MSHWWQPVQAKPEEKYLTVFECLDLCKEYIKSKAQDKKKDNYDLKADEKYRRYTSIIAVVKNSLKTVELDITNGRKKVYVV